MPFIIYCNTKARYQSFRFCVKAWDGILYNRRAQFIRSTQVQANIPALVPGNQLLAAAPDTAKPVVMRTLRNLIVSTLSCVGMGLK